MASGRIVKRENPKKEKAKWYSWKQWRHYLKWYEWLGLSILFVATLFFTIFQHYEFGVAIKPDIWGQYGDFLGGVLGTLLAYISIRLLVENLSAQRQSNATLKTSNNLVRKANKENSDVFRLQQFTDNFKTMFDLYRESVKVYEVQKEGKIITDHAAIHILSKYLQQTRTFNESLTDYREKVVEATKQFDQIIYTPYRDITSVHFRMLYQLFELIRTAKIDEGDKVMYAKLVRSQLSEDELLFLRYNCHCFYGKKMQRNVNHYNLLKHLPLMSLLEMRQWHKHFNDKHKISRLDTEFIALRKVIKLLFDIPQDTPKVLRYSARYQMELQVSGDHKQLQLSIIKNGNAPVDSNQASMDAILDALTLDEQQALFSDFLQELFAVSNFELYNQLNELQISPSKEEIQDKNIHIAKLTLTNRQGKALLISIPEG